ncbi:hypothetical protein BC833DRAFT_597266 [Globomyces pollinis-pini]|nr:hypothetical protein BC833DRAFT_597266 [Globomyces pollinis-pini]
MISEQPLQIPIIDIEPFLLDVDLKKKQQVALQIHEACTKVGFFYVTGHGMQQKQSQGILELAKQFFSLSQEEKDMISINNNDFARGYQKLNQNKTYGVTDYQEGLDFFAKVDENHTLKKRGLITLSGENQYPKQLQNFKQLFEEYVVEMRKIGKMIMHGIAMSLNLNQDFFDQFMDDSFWAMRMIGYPPLSTDDGSISCGEHTDYGCLTILNTDDTTGALQIQTKSGEWVDANPIPGAFVVNIGDMINIWTNDMYKSTLHRVIHTHDSFRISIPFFFEPSYDTIVKPLKECVKLTGNKTIHEPVMYGDHLFKMISTHFDTSIGK